MIGNYILYKKNYKYNYLFYINKLNEFDAAHRIGMRSKTNSQLKMNENVECFNEFSFPRQFDYITLKLFHSESKLPNYTYSHTQSR